VELPGRAEFRAMTDEKIEAMRRLPRASMVAEDVAMSR
jgi:hypothetical protein